MSRSSLVIRPLVRLVVPAILAAPALHAQAKPTIEQYLSPASPLQVTSARKADRVAWMTYDRGLRNVYTAGLRIFAPSA